MHSVSSFIRRRVSAFCKDAERHGFKVHSDVREQLVQRLAQRTRVSLGKGGARVAKGQHRRCSPAPLRAPSRSIRTAWCQGSRRPVSAYVLTTTRRVVILSLSFAAIFGALSSSERGSRRVVVEFHLSVQFPILMRGTSSRRARAAHHECTRRSFVFPRVLCSVCSN